MLHGDQDAVVNVWLAGVDDRRLNGVSRDAVPLAGADEHQRVEAVVLQDSDDRGGVLVRARVVIQGRGAAFGMVSVIDSLSITGPQCPGLWLANESLVAAPAATKRPPRTAWRRAGSAARRGMKRAPRMPTRGGREAQ